MCGWRREAAARDGTRVRRMCAGAASTHFISLNAQSSVLTTILSLHEEKLREIRAWVGGANMRMERGRARGRRRPGGRMVGR